VPGWVGAEKNTKLKQAREEAEREIASYKTDLEDTYQARLKTVRWVCF
jgi:vacuolar-type H+-ATPase subunit H